METITYRLDQFEGPLDLLLTLIQKNKMNIEDIPISIICDQYLEYLREAQSMDMDIAGEFIVMASELMLIKSRMLLPRDDEDENDPRADLADALRRYQQAKEAAKKMAELFKVYSGRMVKDTDEISVDTSFVADQQVTSLLLAVRRIIAANESRPKVEKAVFAPMIAKPIIPVDIKIVCILHRMEKKKKDEPTSMKELLSDATSLPDLIAIFLGILELMKVRRIKMMNDEFVDDSVHGVDTAFVINENPEAEDDKKRILPADPNEPIPLSSKAEMHREQRRILREQRLAERKRQREEERARRTAEKNGEILPPVDDSDLEAEERIAEMLDEELSAREEDLLDDLGLDMNEIVAHMAKQAKGLPDQSSDKK